MGSENMKLANVLVILIFISIQGGRTSNYCYYCKTGDYPPDPVGWVPECGDFGDLTLVVTCPHACGKQTGKTLGGEKWSFHNCSQNSYETNHNRIGCWTWKGCNIGRKDCKECRCSTDLCNGSGNIYVPYPYLAIGLVFCSVMLWN